MTLDDELSLQVHVPAELTARFAAAKGKLKAAIASSAALAERMQTSKQEPRVLVVDDHEGVADGLADVIHAETGAEVIVVTDAVRALYLVHNAPEGCYAAAIIDLDLGHHTITGATVAKALPRGVSVILVTGVAPDALDSVARDVSARETFEKPLEGDVLMRLVGAVRASLPRGNRERADSIH